tara:strand:+ start:9724 stop:9981 length:258 start_codon:yes stop_codon:yes gene_type:complete
MTYIFVDESWEDYLYWQKIDKKMLKRINLLIKDISRQPYEGIGKPEPLKHNYRGFWSRRINKEHRLIYQVRENEIRIIKCRFHYD